MTQNAVTTTNSHAKNRGIVSQLIPKLIPFVEKSTSMDSSAMDLGVYKASIQYEDRIYNNASGMLAEQTK